MAERRSHRRTKPATVEKYTIGSTDTVKRGFLKEFCDFTKKKGTADVETLVKEFSGRQIDGHKVDAARVARYIRYCVNNGQFAEWIRFFGIDKVCTLSASGIAAEEVYSAPAELALEDGERVKARTNGTRSIQELVPCASEILAANAETLTALATRLNENGQRVLGQVKSKLVLPQVEWILTRDDIDSICRQ